MKDKNGQNPRHRKSQRRSAMLPVLLTFAGLVLLAGGIWAFTVSSAGNGQKGGGVPIEVSGAPSLRVDKEQVDLGDVQLGETVTVEFSLANVGDQPLRFSEAPYVELAAGC